LAKKVGFGFHAIREPYNQSVVNLMIEIEQLRLIFQKISKNYIIVYWTIEIS
jgi:hypothetical protein